MTVLLVLIENFTGEELFVDPISRNRRFPKTGRKE
jgi:hypothetical protein